MSNTLDTTTTTQPVTTPTLAPPTPPTTTNLATGATVAPSATPTLAPEPMPSRLSAATNAAPKLSPAAVVGAASSATTATGAAVNAQVIQITSESQKMAQMLSAQGVDWQKNYWKNLSDSAKSLLAQGGYKPPAPTDGSPGSTSGGFWHGIVHAADAVRHAGSGVFDALRHYAGDAEVATNDALIKAPSAVFNKAMAPVAQLERDVVATGQSRLMGEGGQLATSNNEIMNPQNQSVGGRVMDWLQILNPATLIHNWGSVQNGAMSFQPASIQYVQKYMGIVGPKLQLAKEFASIGGMPKTADALKQILAGIPQGPQRQAVADTILNDANFAKAVTLLTDSHLSFGQALFGGLSAQQMHQVDPFTKIGAIQGASAALDVAAGAAGGLAVVTGGPGAAMGDAAAGAGAGDALLAGADATTALDSLGTLKGATAAALTTGAGLGGARAAMTGQSADKATQISPFGSPVNPLSGIADGLISWYANPAFIAMQARGAYNVARYGATVLDSAGAGRDVAHFYTTDPAGIRKARQWAEALTKSDVPGGTAYAKTPNFAAVERLGMKTLGMTEDINKAYPAILEATIQGHPETAVAQYFASDQAMINLFRGLAGGFYKDDILLPHMTLPQSALAKVRGLADDLTQGRRFNPAKMSLSQLTRDIMGDSATNAAKAEMEGAGGGLVARMGRRFTNLAPLSVVDFSKAEAATTIQRLARTALPADKADQAYNAFLQIPMENVQLKDDFYKGLLNDVFGYMGIDKTADGQAWLADFWNREHYTATGGAMYKNPYNLEAPAQENAIGPSQLSNMRAVPNYQELYKFSKKSLVMSTFQMGLNNDMFDRFMSTYWKRVVLLRPGFAIRFAGEEMLNFMLRNNPAKYLQAAVARSLTNAANPELEARAASVADLAKEAGLSYDNPSDIAAINKLDAGRLYSALTGHIPEEARSLIKTRGELLASIQGWHAIKWAQRIGLKIVPEMMLKGAKSLADHGVAGTAYEDHISAIGGHRSVYFGDQSRSDVEASIHTLEGTPVSITRSGPYRSYGREDSELIPHLHFVMSGIPHDSLFRQVAAAWAKGGPDGQLQAGIDWMKGQKIRDEIAAAKASGDEELAAMHEARLAKHETFVNTSFRVAHKTPLGETVGSGAVTQDEIYRAWAQKVVDHVNSLTMTPHGQMFRTAEGKLVTRLREGEEGERVATSGLQPIQLRPTLSVAHPWQIGSRDVGRSVAEVEEGKPYEPSVPEGHVRLFKGENTTTSQPISADLKNPGRTWSPSYQDAVNRAGEGGTVYKIDVPVGDLTKHYDFTGNAEAHTSYLNDIMDSQHPLRSGKKIIRPPHDPQLQGHFESGNIRYGRESVGNDNLLINRLGAGDTPSYDELAKIERIHWPEQILAPEQIAKVNDKGRFNQFMEWGMHQLVGRPSNWLSRQPIFTYNYSLSLDQATKFLASRGITDSEGLLAHDIAMDRAFNMTVPFIHDPQARSQFSNITRNLWPFWFAQEQFYKRWARLFGTYPEAWYKLSQTMNGLKNVGFVYTDQYGKDAFVYPGSQAVLSFLANSIFQANVPVTAGFSGEIAALNPTLTTGGAPWPSFGPAATVPFSIMGGLFTHLEPLVQASLGPQAPPERNGDWATQVIDQMLPSLAARLSEWYIEPKGGTASSPGNAMTNIGSALFMSASVQAMQQLAAAGHDLNAKQQTNLRDKQQYIDRVANWTKNLILIRAWFGLLAPASPAIKINDNGQGAILNSLMAELPYDQAVTEFIKRFPNATPETIFESTTSGPGQSGTYIPATTQAESYINANADFFTKYPQIAPWTIPLSAAKGTFSATTYNQEIGQSLRVKLNLNDVYDNMKYAEAANVYYPLETLMQAAESSTTATSLAAQATLGITYQEAQTKIGMPGAAEADVKARWSEFKTNFDKMHPVFSSLIASKGATSMARRTQVVAQLQDAISNTALPPSTWSSHIEILMAAYDNVQNAYEQTGANALSSSQKSQNKQAFLTWATQYVAQNPDVSTFWNGVLVHQVPG